jgi:alpha-amylase
MKMISGVRQAIAMGLSLLALASPVAAAVTPSPLPIVADAWRDQVIYLVLTDRFFNGDRTNDGHPQPNNPFGYHGGDLAGIIKKLDYIKDLGATAIWLTPFLDNQDTAVQNNYWGYHGYWIQNFEKVDEHMGTAQTPALLVKEAHKRGLKVLFDMVVNHMGYDAPMVHNPKYHDWFHHNGSVTDWNDPYQNQNYDIAGLPDLNSENAQVLNYFERVDADWIRHTGVDGFRLDTVRHVPIPFWQHFNERMHQTQKNFFLTGEVSYHDPKRVAPFLWQAGLDSAFDFPMFETLTDVFAKGQSMRLLHDRLLEDIEYPHPEMLSPFLDSHDEDRFLTTAGNDERKLRLALVCLLSMRGVPMIYYGTEVGMQGGHDPDNRKDMAWGQNPALHDYTRKLLHLRQELAPLRRGKTVEWLADEQVYAFSRVLGNDEVLVVLNNGNKAQTRVLHVALGSGMRDGDRLVDRLAVHHLTVASSLIRLSLEPKQAEILTVKRRL